MDLKFSRVKAEIIKKVEASEDSALLDWILQELESTKPIQSDLIVPISKEEYQTKIERSIASGQNGLLYTTQEIRERYASRKKSASI
jgi:hypothetical protein